MAISSHQHPLWWDRESDPVGRTVRPDVRAAARSLWHGLCAYTSSILGDATETAALLEKSVFQISRYLDQRGAVPFGGSVTGLLTVAFCRALSRYVAKVRRVKTVGGTNELADLLPPSNPVRAIDLQLDVERIVRFLNEPASLAWMLRSAGHKWEDIASATGTTADAARQRFWREIKRVRLKIVGQTGQ
jgi:hypothetical protein